MLFNDTWSQLEHSVSCMTILFLNLQITRSYIRPHIKLAVSLVIAIWSLESSSGVCVDMYGLEFWDG